MFYVHSLTVAQCSDVCTFKQCKKVASYALQCFVADFLMTLQAASAAVFCKYRCTSISVWICVLHYPLSALTLVGWQEGHTTCRNLAPAILRVSYVEELWETWPNLE